jgi:uncharacterized protein YqeY
MKIMSIQEQIKKDLTAAMKAKDEDRKSALRIILGEFSRGDAKTLSDDAAVKILRKLIKSEQETLARSGKTEGDSVYIRIVSAYLPNLADDDEIRQWIAANIDFSTYKNKMQAMRDIMAHFGPRADGARVKAILESI